MSQISWNRWLEAQEYERSFWRKRAERIEDGTAAQLDWYDWRARRVEQHLAAIGDSKPTDARIVEIGSGPIGVVNGLDWGERFAVDPLEPFYSQTPSLTKLRRPGATYLAGTGERLPMDDASVALVIAENVIDHTYAPATILQEISRVLQPGGSLYLLLNVHTWWGALLHTIMAVLRIDRGHPYTFRSASLRRLLAAHGFTIMLEEIESYEEARRNNRQSAAITDKIKGYTGLSEFQHIVVCHKAGEASAV